MQPSSAPSQPHLPSKSSFAPRGSPPSPHSSTTFDLISFVIGRLTSRNSNSTAPLSHSDLASHLQHSTGDDSRRPLSSSSIANFSLFASPSFKYRSFEESQSMFSADSAEWWAPQRDFTQCSGGLSISEWCSIARDTCCALCPQAPITGPATFIVFTLGPALNLLMVLILTQEAPYNLALTTIGTDGLLLSSIVRTFKTGGGLSAYHYYYLPVYIVSCVPLAVGASLTSVSALTGIGGGDAVKHGALYGTHNQFEADEKGVMRKGYLVKHPTRDRDAPKVYAHHGLLDAHRIADTPRPRLGRVITITWAVHLLMWMIVFPYLYFAPNIVHTQTNCNEEFGLTGSWKITFAITAFSWLLIAILFFIPLAMGLSRKNRHSSLMMIARASHSKRFVDFVWTHQTLCRCSVAGFLYALWVIPFISYYIKSLMTFLLLGDDPFDFGQLNWVISSLAVIFVISRSIFDYRDATRKKHQDLHDDANQRTSHRRTHGMEAGSPAVVDPSEEINPLDHPHRRDSSLQREQLEHPRGVSGFAALTQYNPDGFNSRRGPRTQHPPSMASTSRRTSHAPTVASTASSESTWQPVPTPHLSLTDLHHPYHPTAIAGPSRGGGGEGEGHELQDLHDPEFLALHDQFSDIGRSNSEKERRKLTRSGSRGGSGRGRGRGRPRGGSVGSSSHGEGLSHS